MKTCPPRAGRPSAGGLAGPPDALIELSGRRLGLGSEVPVEHRLERLVMADGESVVAGFVMRAHQQTMSLFVVWLELEKLFEGPHGGLGFLPLELQRRELLRRGDELTVGLFALPLDPRLSGPREILRDAPPRQLAGIGLPHGIARHPAPRDRGAAIGER